MTQNQTHSTAAQMLLDAGAEFVRFTSNGHAQYMLKGRLIAIPRHDAPHRQRANVEHNVRKFLDRAHAAPPAPPELTPAVMRIAEQTLDEITGGKPWICTTCDMYFATKKQLTGHRLVHAPKKQCDLCSYATNRAINITRHKAKKHGVVAAADRPTIRVSATRTDSTGHPALLPRVSEARAAFDMLDECIATLRRTFKETEDFAIHVKRFIG